MGAVPILGNVWFDVEGTLSFVMIVEIPCDAQILINSYNEH